MKQSSLDLSLSVKKTRKREFLCEINAVVAWVALVQYDAACNPQIQNRRDK